MVSDQDHGVQPRVTILLNIKDPDNSSAVKQCQSNTDCSGNEICDLTVSKCAPSLAIQTTVSQRNLNIVVNTGE